MYLRNIDYKVLCKLRDKASSNKFEQDKFYSIEEIKVLIYEESQFSDVSNTLIYYNACNIRFII